MPQARQIEVFLASRNSDCVKREAAKIALIAWIEAETKPKTILRVAEKQKSERIGLITSECEERKTELPKFIRAALEP